MKRQIILLSIIFLLVGGFIVTANAKRSPQVYSSHHANETTPYKFPDEILEPSNREEQSSPGVRTILFLRDEEPHLSEIPQTNLVSHSAYLDTGAVLSWDNYFLTQDIIGTDYYFHIYAASDDTTYFKAELFIGDRLVAETTFFASSRFWYAKGGEVAGIDPDANPGAELVLKITHIGGVRGGIVWGQFSQDGSFILIPPYKIINPPRITFHPDEFNVNLITGDSLKQKLIIENNGSSKLWFHLAEREQQQYLQNSLFNYTDQTYWYKQQPDLNADGFNDYTDTKTSTPFPASEITSLGEGDIIHSIPAPNGNAEGLTWDGNYLWNADISSQMIYKLDPADGTILQSFPSPFWNIEGLAWDGTYLWASMIVNKIFKINPATGDTVSSFRAPGNWLHGITYDGYYIWGISFVNSTIYQTDPTTNYTIVNAIPAPSSCCIGLAWDGQYLWVGDIENNQLHQLNPITGSIIRTIKSPVSNPRDLAWDGQYLWIASLQTRTIYQVDVGATPDVTWLSENPIYGFIVPGEKQEIEIDFNTQNLTIDDYSSNLSLISNDPTNQQSTIPVFMKVRSALFSDVSSSANLGDEGVSIGFAVGDYDDDADLDLYLFNNGANKLYRNNGFPIWDFTDVTTLAGVEDAGEGSGPAFFDYNNDGLADLLVVNNNGKVLFKNNGDGTFSNVSSISGIDDTGSTNGYAIGDYDKDGYLDIYFANWGTPNKLYKNSGPPNWNFTDVTASAGVGANTEGHACIFFDYDKDNDLDIYVSNYYAANILYRNNGDGTFADVAAAAGVNYGARCRGVTSFDYDNDGDLDLYITRGRYDAYYANVLYRNNGAPEWNFSDVTAEAGVGNTGDGGVSAIGDYDNDGDLDIYVANSWQHPTPENVLYRNNGDGTFTDVALQEGVTAPISCPAANFWDYNNDGNLDIYTANNQGANILYKNLGLNNHWFKVKLIGSKSNTSAIGAKIYFIANAKRQMREVNGDNLGMHSFNSQPIHFGMGTATTVDSLIIHWPSGIEQVITNLSVDQLVSITEPYFKIENDQYHAAIAVAPDSNFIITYIDKQYNNRNIYAQRFNANGDSLSAKFQVNDMSWQDSESASDIVDIAMAGDRSFVIVWEQTKNYKSFAQRFDASGNKIGNCIEFSYGYQPAVAMAQDGSFMIVYKQSSGLSATLYSSTGDIKRDEFRVSKIMEYHRYPDVVALPTGGFVVTWEAEVSMGVIRIYAQRYDADGNDIGGNFRVDDDPEHFWKHSPAIAATDDGSFFIVWDDYRCTDYGIFGQRFDNAGNKQGINFKINDQDASPGPKTPAVAMNTAGECIVTWVDYRNGAADIYAQRYFSDGMVDGANYKINQDTGNADQISPAVAYHDNMIYHVWQEQVPEQGWDIFFRIETRVNKTIYVPDDCITIQQAIDHAMDGDTIHVAPGCYDISSSIMNDHVNNLIVLGSRNEDGSNASIIQALANPGTFNCLVFKGVSGCKIEGFEVIQGSAGIILDSCQSCLITNNYIHHHTELTAAQGKGIGIFNSLHIDITFCIIDSNEFCGIALNNSEYVNIQNNTILRTARYDGIAFSDNSNHLVIKNNIIAYNKEEGIETYYANPSSFVHDYNCFWQNGKDPINGHPIGSHSILVDPLFVDLTSYNYFLQPGSPCSRTGENGANIGALGVTATAVSNIKLELPTTFELNQNYPNPFNAETQINYQLAENSQVTIKIYNLLGQEVRTLIKEEKVAGYYTIHWDGKDNNGNHVVSGIYLCQIKAGSFISSRKMVILK